MSCKRAPGKLDSKLQQQLRDHKAWDAHVDWVQLPDFTSQDFSSVTSDHDKQASKDVPFKERSVDWQLFQRVRNMYECSYFNTIIRMRCTAIWITPMQGVFQSKTRREFIHIQCNTTNNPGFFQHRMESLLSRYLWKTVLVYIDDVIVFSQTQDEQSWWNALSNCVSLSLGKYHFGYNSLIALGHCVSRFSLAMHEDKIEAISNLAYPKNFSQLESGLGLFGFRTKYVWVYSAIVEPVEILKMSFLRQAPRKGAKCWIFGTTTKLEIDDICCALWDAGKEVLKNGPDGRLWQGFPVVYWWTEGNGIWCCSTSSWLSIWLCFFQRGYRLQRETTGWQNSTLALLSGGYPS